MLLNSTAVYLKWKPPPSHTQNGALKSYNIIVRGIDVKVNYSKILSNVTIDAFSSTLLLANLTEGVTYTVTIAAANSAGMGPYTDPATLRLDPITKTLDQSTHRYPIHPKDDFVTQPWFIIILGAILVIMMLSFGIMVIAKRKQMMIKKSALSSLRGATGVHKLTTMPRNDDGYWMDPNGIMWRHPKDQIQDYAPVCTTNTLPLEQNRPRFEYTEIPGEYAEVAAYGARNDENEKTSEYERTRSPAPYATTTLLNGRFVTNTNEHQQQQHYGNYGNYGRNVHSESYFNPNDKINITENKLANNMYNPSMSVPQTPLGSMRNNNRFKMALYNGDSKMGSVNSLGGQQKEQFYIKVGELNPNQTWNNHQNIYQNSMGSIGSQNDPKNKVYLPSNRSVISYRSASVDYAEDVWNYAYDYFVS